MHSTCFLIPLINVPLTYDGRGTRRLAPTTAFSVLQAMGSALESLEPVDGFLLKFQQLYFVEGFR